ncbi:MAG: dNTP triphosphohydrolase, partial [Melioribacteraceae bacterium]|nr:dNTP triphosphohydrolase [Melioribacteraceae bacterium]
CLTHDLGHPPFGHAGERTLHKLMRPYGGFEGNAQTLRLITEIFYRSNDKRRGMNPTRAFVDSILKYKCLFGEMNDPENHFLYDYQKVFLEFTFKDVPDVFKNLSTEQINSLRSIECQIMDWADDTAYAINDLVDSISGGFITLSKLYKWKEGNADKISDLQLHYLNEIIDWMKIGNYKPKFGSQVGDFIHACRVEENEGKLSKKTNRYKFNLVIDESYLEKVELYKTISSDIVFKSSQLHQIEYKGDKMLSSIFKVFEENYISYIKKIKLLPDFSDKIVRNESDSYKRARLICDQLAGMTDSFAMRNYKRLFDADYSSLTDVM